MKLWDVNIWVYAFRKDSPMHALARKLLTEHLESRDGFLFNPMIAASFLRLVTNPRIFVQPSSIDEAWRFIDYLETDPSAERVDIDQMTWGIFKHTSIVARSAGNEIPDALVAALALRHDATLVTADKGFSAYPGIDVELVARA